MMRGTSYDGITMLYIMITVLNDNNSIAHVAAAAVSRTLYLLTSSIL